MSLQNYVEKRLENSMSRIALRLENELRLAAPVNKQDVKNKGNLRRSIVVVWQNGMLKIFADDYIFHVEFGCFFGQTKIKILTKRGWKKLKDIKVGDLVWTHKQRWKKVTHNHQYPVNRRIPRYTIQTKTDKKITVTEEHPFMTKRGWVKAKDLMEEDILLEV